VFDSLSDRLTATLRAIGGKSKLTEENIGDTLREVRRALLEADVALDVVKGFVDRVRERALGMEVSTSLSPGQAFVKVVHEELVHVMGDANAALELAVRPPAIILLAGLQGAGKTTTVAKLARFLTEREKKQVMVVSTDVRRPAAIDQLARLAEQVGVDFFPSTPDQDPVAIAEAAVTGAKQRVRDVLIVDTAGRLAVDEEMMDEVRRIHRALDPAETLFVVDAMTGQDAANTAKAFAEALPLTGVVLSKADGDARGGAALSVRQVTGAPIKFLGVGEKIEALEPFHPERMASRILGMGDVLTLIEEAERKLDRKKADKLARKIQKGKSFDLEDFRDQLQQMKKMGGMTGMLDKLPGMGQMGKAAEAIDQKHFDRLEAMIGSMTPHERRFPDVINGSRKQRIARGSGMQIQDVNRLLKQHKQMQKMMKKLGKKGGMQKMMRGMGAMMGGQGGLPPGGGGMPPGGLPPGFRR
jgi:signal recognition particle subunit SRP54